MCKGSMYSRQASEEDESKINEIQELLFIKTFSDPQKHDCYKQRILQPPLPHPPIMWLKKRMSLPTCPIVQRGGRRDFREEHHDDFPSKIVLQNQRPPRVNIATTAPLIYFHPTGWIMFNHHVFM
eukprot:TRINITY_DN2237_c0_g1_i3.p2 TRINITY_DN2237_c0_g1~~TRINITY_DN2237_c0_g1_i3.p2  ORF type:complete len:125 (+),score=11.33 TRINITY_DN2237_c0_g1_i3:2334-2708(+)